MIAAALMTKRELSGKKIDLLGVLVNRVERGQMHALSRECQKSFQEAGIPVWALVPLVFSSLVLVCLSPIPCPLSSL